MDTMEDKISAILSNPQLMQQIMGMAQTLSQNTPPDGSQENSTPSLPNIDPVMLQRLAALSRQGGITQEQQTLLQALTPYLAADRIAKLEKAMRAAKMAKFASSFLNSGGLQLLTGR